ncbi:hypothetical protein HDU83_009335 [Entophlyctis luteolus]|nr:hypothetical protein HDU83_009335 [Entophlyctis luteolus]
MSLLAIFAASCISTAFSAPAVAPSYVAVPAAATCPEGYVAETAASVEASATTTTHAAATAAVTTTAATVITSVTTTVAVPAVPTGLGFVDSVPVPSVLLLFVDNVATNIKSDPCHANLTTNVGVRVLMRYLDIWTPSTLLVDAGVTLAASGSCPAITASNWTGIPGDSTDGHVVNAAVHTRNIQFAENVTESRTSAQELQAYLDDRRNKGYSVVDGMGPLTSAWVNLTQQTTTITSIASNATTVLYNDGGNNIGVIGSANTLFGVVTSFINSMGNSGSTEPPKRFYKYARPFRWSTKVVVVPALVPAESTTPTTDGGFPSGHTAEAYRDSIGMAFVVPQRFQEMISRAAELGFSRILAGMHSPLDVMGGARHGTAVAAANIYAAVASNASGPAYEQAQSALTALVGSSLYDYAHSATTATDRFADHNANKALFKYRLTYGFSQIGASGVAAVVPKGAEVLLLTRLPYLTPDQIRVVLKTTALDSGYPVLDDEEGWGRLNLFDAADGYGRFDGDVVVTMNASLGGFSAKDSWNNDISGAGMLTKLGTGSLTLTGANSYSGGTLVKEGTLVGASATAFGSGALYVSGGAVTIAATVDVSSFTQVAGTLTVDATAGSLVVKGLAYIGAGAQLIVNFESAPAAGSSFVVVQCLDVYGTFGAVTFTGAVSAGTVSYTAAGVVVSF